MSRFEQLFIDDLYELVDESKIVLNYVLPFFTKGASLKINEGLPAVGRKAIEVVD